MKQIIILRKDLDMSPGKAAAQACHASLNAYIKTEKKKPKNVKQWFEEGQTKVCLTIDDLQSFNDLMQDLVDDIDIKPYVYAVRDAGHTEIPAGSFTAIGIGPIDEDDIDPYTRKLKLYK